MGRKALNAFPTARTNLGSRVLSVGLPPAELLSFLLFAIHAPFFSAVSRSPKQFCIYGLAVPRPWLWGLVVRLQGIFKVGCAAMRCRDWEE